MGLGYIRFEKLEKYSYFKGVPVKSPIQKAKITNNAINFGMAGGISSTIQADIENKNKIHYVFNKETGSICLFNKDFIIRGLQTYDNLLADFQKEENNESLAVLQKYLYIINKIEKGAKEIQVSE